MKSYRGSSTLGQLRSITAQDARLVVATGPDSPGVARERCQEYRCSVMQSATLLVKCRRSARIRLTLPVVGLAILASSTACRREAIDEDPERLVKEFIDRAKGAYGDPKMARGAFDFLWSSAQKNLTERATRASALASRKVAPEEMLALTRFSLRFVPQRYQATVQGDVAVVTLQGDSHSKDRADVRCVREQGRWRIAVELPPLPPIQRRSDANNDEE